MTLHPPSRSPHHHRRPRRRFRRLPSVQSRASPLCTLEWLPWLCLAQKRRRQPQPPRPSATLRDWCSKCPRKGIASVPGLTRHITCQHAGSTVDEPTCALFVAIERVTCSTPSCGGLRRAGESALAVARPASAGAVNKASAEEFGAPSPEQAARFHSADPLAPGQHLAPRSLELSPAHDRRGRAVLAGHGSWQ